MMSLVQDPSVWVAKNNVRLSMSDILFIAWNLPLFLKILLFLIIGPPVPTIVSFASNGCAVVMDLVKGINWMLMSQTTTMRLRLAIDFIQDHQQALLAPLLWFTLLCALVSRTHSRSAATRT